MQWMDRTFPDKIVHYMVMDWICLGYFRQIFDLCVDLNKKT